ncbi:MAG: hypothetical protein ACRCY1_06665 [Leuconostoc suionicum]|uniref:hypothetical protein n=1 Tax=Leuconostoc suionicum TaxID=1511761 RepID=UPI003F3EEAD9
MDIVLNFLETFKNKHKILYFVIGLISLIGAFYINYKSKLFINDSSRHIETALIAGFLVFINFILLYIPVHFIISLVFKLITLITKEKNPVRLTNYYTSLTSFLYALSVVPWTVADALLTISLAIMLPVIVSFYKGGQGTTFIARLENALYQNISPHTSNELPKKGKTDSLSLTTYNMGEWIIKHDPNLIVTTSINQKYILAIPKETLYSTDTESLVIKLGENSLTIKQSSIYKITLKGKKLTIVRK